MESPLVLVATVLVAGCAAPRDDIVVLPCPNDKWGGNAAGCAAAQIFAARDSAELVVPPATMDLYFARWVRVIDAEPVLWSRIPQIHRNRPANSVGVWTTNPLAIAAWKDLRIETGDLALDAIVAQLRPTAINPFADDHHDGSFSFTLERVRAIYSEELLQLALEPTSSWLYDAQEFSGDEGTWLWLDDTAQIDFRFGWGDCLVDCAYHSLRAIVPPVEPAVVYDLGGDPLPVGLELSPNTKPPP